MTSNQPWWLTMPPAELAARILPHFGYRPHEDEQMAMASIVKWCKTGSYDRSSVLRVLVPPSGTEKFLDPDMRAVAEAIQVLERAGLLMRSARIAGAGGVPRPIHGFYVGLTRLGMHVLQTNTVRQHLGLGDAGPPA